MGEMRARDHEPRTPDDVHPEDRIGPDERARRERRLRAAEVLPHPRAAADDAAALAGAGQRVGSNHDLLRADDDALSRKPLDEERL